MALSSVFRISIRLLGIPSLPPVCQYLPPSTAGESTSSCSGWRSGSALEIAVKGNIASQVGVDVGYETLSSTPACTISQKCSHLDTMRTTGHMPPAFFVNTAHVIVFMVLLKL